MHDLDRLLVAPANSGIEKLARPGLKGMMQCLGSLGGCVVRPVILRPGPL